MKIILASILTIVTIIAGLAAGCGGGNTTTSPTTTSPTSTPVETFGSISQQGTQVFSTYCSQCHGPSGGGGSGPAVIGDNANLAGTYSNAKELYDFIRVAMPANLPGSLSALQYQQVLCYLMVKNNFVESQVVFDAGGLDQVPIS